MQIITPTAHSAPRTVNHKQLCSVAYAPCEVKNGRGNYLQQFPVVFPVGTTFPKSRQRPQHKTPNSGQGEPFTPRARGVNGSP